MFLKEGKYAFARSSMSRCGRVPCNTKRMNGRKGQQYFASESEHMKQRVNYADRRQTGHFCRFLNLTAVLDVAAIEAASSIEYRTASHIQGKYEALQGARCSVMAACTRGLHPSIRTRFHKNKCQYRQAELLRLPRAYGWGQYISV